MPIHELVTSTDPKEVFSGRFWRVTAPNGAVNFMYGTGHFKDSYINTLSPELKLAIGLSDEILLETYDRQMSIKELAGLLVLNVNLLTHPACTLGDIEHHLVDFFSFAKKMLEDCLNQEDFKRAVNECLGDFHFKEPLKNAEQLLEPEYFKQLSFYTLLYLGWICAIYPPANWGNGSDKEELDSIIKKNSIEQNRLVIALETEMSRFEAFFILSPQEQYDLFCSFNSLSSTQEHDSTIVEKILKKLKDDYERFVFKYKYATNRLFDYNSLSEKLESNNYFDRFALLARNQQMFAKFYNKFYDGNKSVNVGVKHYEYSYGLISMLASNGFKIERVYETPNILYMYSQGLGLAVLSGALAIIHPRFRKAGKILSFSSAALTSVASIDMINAHRPPEKSLLWAASRAIKVGVVDFKNDLTQRLSHGLSYKS